MIRFKRNIKKNEAKKGRSLEKSWKTKERHTNNRKHTQKETQDTLIPGWSNLTAQLISNNKIPRQTLSVEPIGGFHLCVI